MRMSAFCVSVFKFSLESAGKCLSGGFQVSTDYGDDDILSYPFNMQSVKDDWVSAS